MPDEKRSPLIESWLKLFRFHLSRGTGRAFLHGSEGGRDWTKDDFAAAFSHNRATGAELSQNTLASWLSGQTFPSGTHRVALFKTFWPQGPRSAQDRIEYNDLRDALALAHASLARDRTDWVAEETAARLAAEAAPRGLVVNSCAGDLPDALYLTQQVHFRDDQIARLRELFERWKGSRVSIGVLGPPGAGKTTLLQAFATGLAAEARGPDELAVLHVDVSASRRPLRAIANAFRGHAANSAGVFADYDDDDESQYAEAEFVQSQLLGRVGHRSLVVVLEGVSEIFGHDEHLRELQAFLNSGGLNRAFQLLEMRGETVGPLSTAAPFLLPPFTAEQACEFLIRLGQPADRSKMAVDLLHQDYNRILQPGLLGQGARRYDPALPVADDTVASGWDLAVAIEAAAGEIARQVIERLCDVGKCRSEAALLGLMAMAVFGSTEIPARVRAAAGIATLPLEGLVRLGWVNGDARLAGFALHALQAAGELTLAGRDPRTNAADLREAVARLSLALLEARSSGSASVLDGAVGWLERRAKSETSLLRRVLALHIQETQADAVQPLKEDEQRTEATRLLEDGLQGDLDAALAALVLHAVPAAITADDTEAAALGRFLRSAGCVVQVASATALSGRQLIVLDTALYRGARRFHAFEQILEVSASAAEVLKGREPTALEEQDKEWLSGWLSFLINLADGNLGAGRAEAARVIVDRAIGLLAQSDWWPRDSWKAWLSARLHLLNERLSPSAEARQAALTNAMADAARAVAEAPEDPRCIKFYIRVATRLVRAERDEAARRAHVDQARAYLETILGATCDWPVEVRGHMAALMRDEARRAWNQPYQRDRAREALRVLYTDRKEGASQVEADPRATLVGARLKAFVGDRAAALADCERSLRLAPSPAAWHLKLRLLDDSDGGVRDWSGEPLMNEAHLAPLIPRPLRAAIKQLRDWTRVNRAWRPGYGRVLLWAIRREWKSEGSIDHAVVRSYEAEGRDYDRAPREERLTRLQQVFKARLADLDRLETRFGASVAIVVARFETTSQYHRSISVVSGEAPDMDAVLDVFSQALDRWPGNHFLRYRRAEYLRYMWSTDDAIVEFRSVVISATNGDLRREAAVALCRALHTRAVFGQIPEEQRRADLIEAKRIAVDLTGTIDHEDEVAILRDHIALELGETVNWTALDDAYKAIVGQIDGFPSTLVREFEHVQGQGAPTPTNVSEALWRNFADSEVLGLAGTLYLRRAEKAQSNSQDDDFMRAVAFFRAEALLERSWEGRERAVTSFRIGRAILSAAQLRHERNPIHELGYEGKASQLALAESKFSSAVSRSTGSLREVARAHVSRITHLRNVLDSS